MSPEPEHFCTPLGRSLDLTATSATLPAAALVWLQAVISTKAAIATNRRMAKRLGPGVATSASLCQHASGLVMPIDLQAAAHEYIGWLQLEANRSPNTVRAYDSELKKLITFLSDSGHTLQMADLRHEDLRAYQRRLAARLKSPASRARALVAVRSWLRWVARE